MSDQELNQLSNGGYGGDLQDPFTGSSIEKKKKPKVVNSDLDFEQEYEDPTKDPVVRLTDETEKEFIEDSFPEDDLEETE